MSGKRGKLRLDPDGLAVETFSTAREKEEARGTVRGYATFWCPDDYPSQEYTDCTDCLTWISDCISCNATRQGNGCTIV